MGREIKRVPLDFQWPIDKVWQGFINPHYEGHSSKCPDCNGRGSTIAMQRLGDLVHLLMISGGDAAKGKCHPWLHESALLDTQGIVPSKDMVELTQGLAGRAMNPFFGHDGCDRWAACRAIIKAAKLKKSWGTCKKCNGHGNVWDDPKNKRRAERWKSKEPPQGEGYQLWETVSEGSPISPVFKTPEELAEWLATSMDYTWRNNDQGTTKEQWLKFINGPGWAPTFISDATGLKSGVDAV